MPDGLLEAGRADLPAVYHALDSELARHEFVSGGLSIADFAQFPHLASAKAMEAPFSAEALPNLTH
jgi:glutathione S-transferase